MPSSRTASRRSFLRFMLKAHLSRDAEGAAILAKVSAEATAP